MVKSYFLSFLFLKLFFKGFQSEHQSNSLDKKVSACFVSKNCVTEKSSYNRRFLPALGGTGCRGWWYIFRPRWEGLP